MPNSLINLLKQKKKQPTASFGTKTGSVLNISEGERAVITYTSASDKMKVFSTFILEGLENGELVFYTYPDNESADVRKNLVQNGIDPEKGKKCEKSGSLILRTLTEHYMSNRIFNKENVIKKELELRAAVKKAGYKRFRYLDDLGNLSFLGVHWQAFIDYWYDPAWGLQLDSNLNMPQEPPITELTAINVENMNDKLARDILNTLSRRKQSSTRLIDFLEYSHAFSNRIGVTHEELLGRKFLLEFDPTSDYERIVEDFAKEALANLEPIYVLTRNVSSVNQSLTQQRSIRFVLMSSSASTSQPISQNQIVLPADDTPLILDVIQGILSENANANLFLIFDNLSELIMCIGFDKVYKFLLYVLEMMPSKRTTALFLINKSAHEPNMASQIKGLFHNILAYEQNEFKVTKRAPNR
jgi:hypothetical protein